jgi:hypothetical protein
MLVRDPIERLLRVDSGGSIRVPRTAGIGTKPGVLDHVIERQNRVDS